MAHLVKNLVLSLLISLHNLNATSSGLLFGNWHSGKCSTSLTETEIHDAVRGKVGTCKITDGMHSISIISGLFVAVEGE